MIDFPASPTVGQQFTAQGVTWTWDGTKWTASGLGTSYLPTAGGTLTGPLTLNADPTVPLGAATAQYADKPRWGENRIINGDMRIDQRNNGASGTATPVYTVDRWIYNGSQPTKGTWQRSPGAASVTGFSYWLSFVSSSAYIPVAADSFVFAQSIEADMVSDFLWGVAGTQPVTLSFWVASSLTGQFGGSLRNYAATRSYPFSYSIPVANTWTKIVLTIPGDTAGTWVPNGNGGSVIVSFDLGSGANFRAAAGAWAAGNITGATGDVNVVGTNGANFLLTGVKLEIGSVATPYNRQSLAKSMADCQRYYETCGYTIFSGNITNAGVYYLGSRYAVVKRAVPTLSFSDLGNTGFPTGAPTVNSNFIDGFSVGKTANANGNGGFFAVGVTASAEL